MKFEITSSSKTNSFVELTDEQEANMRVYETMEEIEITDVEQLLKICRETGCQIILGVSSYMDKDGKVREHPEIEIYNYYIE